MLDMKRLLVRSPTVKKDGTHLIIETYHTVEFAENQDGEMEYIGEVCVAPLPEMYS